MLAWPLRILSLILLGITFLTMLLPRRCHRLRAGLLLGTLTSFAALQLVVTQLSGSGRLSIAALPLLALVLVGPRTGWLLEALNTIIYAGTALMHHFGVLQNWELSTQADPTMSYWALQGLRLVSSMLMLLVLMTLFNALQRRTLIKERQTLRDLEHETAERLRLEHEVAKVSEAERCKLGAELHDDLCQHLTAALLSCAALENQNVSNREIPEITAAMVRMREILEAALEKAYNVAKGLCPLSLDQNGLVPALARLCQSTQENESLTCQFQTDDGLEIADRDTALHLFRIAAEAITNAVKHSHGGKIMVSLLRESNMLVLSVIDDGRGMPQDNDGKSRLGCSIMAYRATLAGGTLAITSEPDKGTAVTCRVPVERGA